MKTHPPTTTRHMRWRPFIFGLFVFVVMLCLALQTSCVPQLCGIDFECTVPTPHCVVGKCVECLGSKDCALDQRCVDYSCRPLSESPATEPHTEPTLFPEEPTSQEQDASTERLPDVQEQHTEQATHSERQPELPPTEAPTDKASPTEQPLCRTGVTRACYDGPTNTRSKGTCKDGVQTCVAEKWGKCIGSVLPATEACDGKDNNCDGQVDEGKPGAGKDCTSAQKGECKAGKTTCFQGAINCNPINTPTKETCDNKDNDCDGRVDEDLSGQKCYVYTSSNCYTGSSLCTNGKLTCSKGSLHRCSGASDCDVCPGGPGSYSCIARFRRCVLR